MTGARLRRSQEPPERGRWGEVVCEWADNCRLGVCRTRGAPTARLPAYRASSTCSALAISSEAVMSSPAARRLMLA
jgi:hypothetical protein